jgi:SAM-dependent methyltransferase
LGTDTGGIYPAEPINGLGVGAGSLPYMGSQPSIVRKALDQLGDVHGKSFIDIGCGKGRPMLVATEYPFKEVLGYDLAPRLVNIANRNAKLVARRFPQRTPMRAYVENALEMALPRGDVVIFLFNPFGASIMTAFLRKLEEGLADSTLKHLNIVYCNPVCAHVFDQSPKLTRRYSALVPYAPEEIGYGTEAAQDVMIWSSVEA